MNKEEHYRRLESMYRHAPINEYFRPTLAVSEGRAEIVMSMRDDFFHAGRAVHGSVYFKALDDAAFFSANSLVDDVFVVTATFNLYLMRPMTGGEARAIGAVIRPGKSLIIAEATLYDSRGREVARGSGSFMRSSLALADAMGYGT